MIISAWHCTHQFFSDYGYGLRDDRTSNIVLGKTHHMLPISFIYQRNAAINNPEYPESLLSAVLDEAFKFFNWIHWEFEAPKEVNKFAKKYGTHASMSTGDLVELKENDNPARYFVCEAFGWKEIAL